MKYSIHRAKNIYGIKKPYERAILEDYTFINFITRKIETIKRWVIELNSMEELDNLINEVGNILICPSFDFGDTLYMLIIYGDEEIDYCF